jgi:hypothetical protein
MALLNNPAASNGTTKDENIYTAQANLAAPKKVSERPVEPVQEFDWDAASKSADKAKAMATTGSVSNNSLVQTQLDNVLASNSPLLKRARQNAAMATAERGLNNSSIGVQAGEEAVISSALPIAQQDASTYGNMDLANLNAQNQFGMAGLSQEFNAYNQNQQNKFTAQESNLERTQREELFNKGNEFTASESSLERAQREDLFNKGNEFSSKQQTDAHNYQLAEIKANADEQIRLYSAQVDDKFQSQYLESAGALQKSFLDQQTAILSNPSLKAPQISNALSVAKQGFDSSIAWLQGLFAQGGARIDASAFPAQIGVIKNQIV